MPRAVANRVAMLALLCWSTAPVLAQVSDDTIDFPVDPLAVASTNEQPGWVKFLIMTDDLDKVIFQNSNTYPFHYDFAVNELPLFAGMNPSQFDQVTLHEQGQLAILGAVILPPLVNYQHLWPEFGIQFVRQEPYDPALVLQLLDTVASSVLASPAPQPFYFPALEQQATAEENATFFESGGYTVSSTARWASGNACYSYGWALGKLKYFASEQIDAAFLNGDLSPTDILLTDGVPAEIPFVAGVLSLSASSPASHVAILAETFDVPFSYLALAEDAQRAQALVGNRIVLRAEENYFEPCSVRLIDVENELDAATIDEILALKEPPPLDIQPMQPYGAYSASTDGLTPADIVHFGGKAANYGLLRQAIPNSSPVATAFSFDLWKAFMDQQLSGGNSLRATIAQMLAGYSYPPDMQSLNATLDAIRDMIKDDGETSLPGESTVLGVLQDPQYAFDPDKKLRFRSSTNVEDGDKFSGAGLYDSFSGCLADDLDGGSGGPSHCDPEENDERGVFRAIRKVFASFYNLNAFLERLRHGVDENDVGMALLVHHSFPDAEELANGVALYEPSTFNVDTRLVSQPGANSVTNPDPGQIPEQVWIYASSGTPTVIEYSNLLPLGATVMAFPQDYQNLRSLLLLAAAAWEQATGVTDDYVLEFEYKKMSQLGGLVVKQIRRVPQADDTPSVTPFLINDPRTNCLFQGEYSDVFANHRLKSVWALTTRNMWLSAQNLQATPFDDVSLDYQEVCQPYRQSGPLGQWPQASHDFTLGTMTDGWRFDSLQNPRQYEIEIQNVPTLVAPSQSPLLTLDDLQGGCMGLRVDYDQPVPSIDFLGQPVMTATDYGLVCRCPAPQPGDQLQQRTLLAGGIIIDTSFYWPPPPEGITAGYTAPLTRFVATSIYGLTSTPITLTGDYSQTYRPEHHNFGENFIFEPALEPGLSGQQLDELAAQGIRVIYARVGFLGEEFAYYDDAAWGDACLGCTGFDADQDGSCTGDPTFDCDDTRADIWATPGEVAAVAFENDSTIVWSQPAAPGGQNLLYDTLRSSEAGDFVSDVACVEFDEGSDLEAGDTAEPAQSEVFFYLVRAENDCPAGQGPLGQDSEGNARTGVACP